jgi:hypothetical protein
MPTTLTTAKLVKHPGKTAMGASIVHSASYNPTTSAQGQHIPIDPRANLAPKLASIVNLDPTSDLEQTSNHTNSHLSIHSTINYTNQLQEQTTNPDPFTVIAQDQHQSFIQFISKLIVVLGELNLIGSVLPASVVTSIARNHKSKMPNLSFRALELNARIMEYDCLVVDGVEISASIASDQNSGRLTVDIEFLTTSNCINSTSANCKKFSPQIDLEEERFRTGREKQWLRLEEGDEQINHQLHELKDQKSEMTGLRAIEMKQREAMVELMKSKSRDDVVRDDTGLIQFIRSTMTRNLKLN